MGEMYRLGQKQMTTCFTRHVVVTTIRAQYMDWVERVHPCLRGPRPSRTRGSTSGASSSYTSPMVALLQDQLQTTQFELQTTKARLCSTEEELRSTREELEATRRQLNEQRAYLLELNARFDSFLLMLGHPTTRGGNSLDSS